MNSILNTAAALALVAGFGTHAFAQGAPSAATGARTTSIAAQAAAQVAPQAAAPSLLGGSTSGRALKWTGAGLFVGGMGVAIYGFLNNENGEYPEFGEFSATSTSLGVAGITTAFAGGALMAIGHRMSRMAPDIQAGPGRLAVSKRMSW